MTTSSKNSTKGRLYQVKLVLKGIWGEELHISPCHVTPQRLKTYQSIWIYSINNCTHRETERVRVEIYKLLHLMRKVPKVKTHMHRPSITALSHHITQHSIPSQHQPVHSIPLSLNVKSCLQIHQLCRKLQLLRSQVMSFGYLILECFMLWSKAEEIKKSVECLSLHILACDDPSFCGVLSPNSGPQPGVYNTAFIPPMPVSVGEVITITQRPPPIPPY